MTETLTVLALFGILAVSASPTFVRLLRDRRVNRAAMHLVDIYRTARTRAMGRGQPMLVNWTQSGTKGRVRLVEPIVTVNAARTNCQTTAWATTAVQEFYRVDLTQGTYELADEVFNDDGGTAQQYADICFMPMGRAYIRTSAANTFKPMAGVASFTVTNSSTGLPRMVFIPPSGVSRLQL